MPWLGHGLALCRGKAASGIIPQRMSYLSSRTIIIAVLALLVIAALLIWRGNASETAPFAELIARGGQEICTITEPVSGTVYISGNRARIDFVADANGGSATISFIRDGGIVRGWTSLSSEGFTTTTPSAGEAALAGSQEMTFTCETWPSVDEQKFTPPADITFSGSATR